jgi:hypothetical protein
LIVVEDLEWLYSATPLGHPEQVVPPIHRSAESVSTSTLNDCAL